MILIKKRYEANLNNTTINCIEDLLKEIHSGDNPETAAQELTKYISKLAKKCFDRGLEEGIHSCNE